MAISDLATTPSQGTFVFARLITFILPIFNLWLVFIQHSNSGLIGGSYSVLHILSNPIDALWSIKFRQESIYHYYLLAISQAPDIAKELTLVSTVYDLWLQEVSPHIKQAFESRLGLQCRNPHDSSLLLEQEKHLIRDCALKLQGYHVKNSAYIGLSITACVLSSIAVAYQQLYTPDVTTQYDAGSTLTLLAILSHLIFAICISGRTDTFQRPEEAIQAVFELSVKLKSLSSDLSNSTPLLPIPSLPTNPTRPLPVSDGASNFLRYYVELGIGSGVLNCIHPHKLSRIIKYNTGSMLWSLITPMCAVLAPFLCATAITLTASSSRDKVLFLMLLGCLLTWIINWLVSMMTSTLLSKRTISIQTHSSVTLACDIVFGIGLIFCCFAFHLYWERLNQTGQQLDTIKLAACLAIMFIQSGMMLLLGCWNGPGSRIYQYVFTQSKNEALTIDEAAWAVS